MDLLGNLPVAKREPLEVELRTRLDTLRTEREHRAMHAVIVRGKLRRSVLKTKERVLK